MANDYGTGYPLFPPQMTDDQRTRPGGLYVAPDAAAIRARTAAAAALRAPRDGFGDEEQAASYPAPRPVNTVAADNSREMQGLQTGVRGGNYVHANQQTSNSDAQTTYGPNDGFGFRTRLAQRGTPGEVISKDYGLGGPNVLATADKNGKFNSFSQAPGGGGPVSSPMDAEIARLTELAAYHRGQGTLTGRIFAANAQKRLTVLRNQQVALGQLGVNQGQLTVSQQHQHLLEQQANPSIAYANAQNALIGVGNVDAVQRIAAAKGGDPNVAAITGMTGTYRVPASQTGFYPGFPQAPGQPAALPASPIPLPPLRRLETNHEGY